MNIAANAIQVIRSPRTREFIADKRNQALLAEAAQDAPEMWRDRGMLMEGKNLKFAANHNHLIRLADNNRELISHLADVTGNPTLEKAASWPTLIHLAAENPRITHMLVG